jgi:hypothetical protein
VNELPAEAGRLAEFLDRPLMVTVGGRFDGSLTPGSTLTAMHRAPMSAMVDPTAPSYNQLLVVVAGLAMLVGLLWLRRVTTLDDHSDRSFWRSHRERGWGSSLPGGPEPPTRGWVVTRAEMAIAVTGLAVAVVAPAVLTRWERAFAFDGRLAILLWVAAVALAAVGTRRIWRIARGDPDPGPSTWRSQARRR